MRAYSQSTYSWWIDISLLFIFLAGLFFLLLGLRPLFVPDEGRYAEIAREMISSGEYITPYLNGIKYFEKPILFYWLEAASIKLLGLNLWAIRGVNASLSMMLCLFTYYTGRQLFDRLTGLLSAFILSTSLLFFMMTQMISLDLPVTVFLSMSLYTFILGANHTISGKCHYYFCFSAIFSALAVLTKGLIGIVFPIAIISTWLLLTPKRAYLNRLSLIIYIALFLVVTVPWHLVVSLENPEFAYFYFIEQQILRYSTLGVGHYQPFWFFIPCLLIGFFPWIVFLPQAIYQAYPRSVQALATHKKELFFLLWIAIIFIFFSFSKSKLIPYILPLFPPLALLTACYLRNAVRATTYAGFQIGIFLLAILSIMLIFAFYHYLPHYTLASPSLAKQYLLTAFAILAGASSIAILYASSKPVHAIVILICGSFLFPLFVLAAMPAIETRTILPLARIIETKSRPQDIIVTYNQYYQDLPFYLRRIVYILNWRNELTYGMAHQAHHEWMINTQQFWEYWQHKQCVFAIMDKTEYEKIKYKHPKQKIYRLGSTIQNTLVSNCSFI